MKWPNVLSQGHGVFFSPTLTFQFSKSGLSQVQDANTNSACSVFLLHVL